MSPKHASSSPPDNPAPRRHFLTWLWGGLGLAALTEFVWMAGSFLRFGRHRQPEAAAGVRIQAGPVDAFVPGSVTAFPRGRFYLARLADGGFLALSRRCPHLGCTLPWVEAEQRFVCPCHASAFDMRGGVVNAPAPRAMDLYAVTIENAMVSVATSQVIKRDRFDPSQVVYPLTA